MQISEVETIPYALPLRAPYRTARGELRQRESVIVRLRCGGAVGLGEGVPLSLRGGPSLEAVRDDLERRCAPALAGAEAATLASGEPAAVRARIEDLLATCGEHGAGRQALAAVDIALHDLAGRLSELPAWRLLGAEAAGLVPCNATLDGGDPAAVAGRAAELARAGFETFKVKVGTGADRERVAAVRSAIGPSARLRIDANGAWDVERAAEMISALEPDGLELVEQPCGELSELAAVRARTSVPIVADESVSGEEEALLAGEQGACDAVTVKLSKVGGMLAALRIAAAIPTYLSSALDGPVGIAAALHLAQALPAEGLAASLAHGLATADLFAEHPGAGPLPWGPAVAPPPGPGLGIELDENALERLRIH